MVIFGGRIVDAKKRAPNKVPLFLEKSLAYLEQHGMDCEGLFRVSGSLENIRKIKEIIEKAGGDIDYDKITVRDAHEVAGVIKLYFRELTEPLVPTAMMREFVNAGANENNSLNEQFVGNLLSRLPPDNYAVMKRLMLFLKKVSEYASVTKMTPDNLALVFSPNLIRDNSTGWEREMMWSGHISSVVAFMINRAASLFNEPGATPAAAPITKPLPPTTGAVGLTGQRKSVTTTPMKRPPSGGRKNLSSLDISAYTLRGEYRVGMAINLPLPPTCLQGCNWGPLVQTGKIAVYTSGESTLVAVVITSDEGKTIAQSIAANVMDTSDSSRYFVIPRSLTPILSPKDEAGISYYGVALYTPEDSIAFRALVDPHRPEDYITHKPNASGTFVLNTNNTTSTGHPRTVSIAPAVRNTTAFRKPVPPTASNSTNQGYTPGAPYRKMINLALDDEELIVYERIVQLSYANVYRCSMGPLCCMVKIFSKPDEKVIQYTLQDHTVKLKHPNLLRSLGSQFEENIFCSFYEYCGNNSVWELMYRHKVEENPLPYRDIKHYATMVARALVYLHENNTPHRDIKSCNVFLDGDEEPFQVVKLGDVCSSLSLNIQWPIMYTSTFPYTPPEVLEDATRVHTGNDAFKIDIWQFGMLMIELETLGMPFEGLSEEDTQNHIMTGRLPPNLSTTSPLLPIIRKCLQINPSDRLSAQEVLQSLNNLAV
eukprot:Phypoly_transcript_03990.p1 GENE.Phypoly_transcript_03990~~Phypoly_transcript_03990.p1  ORF type:complete len:710 (+),score=92.36 Phypoly_transcript_03990:119-2248(+)